MSNGGVAWEQAWQQGRTGWDAGQSPPALVQLVNSTHLKPARALVPGCGAGYDVFTLSRIAELTIGLDLAPTARARFMSLSEQPHIDSDKVRIEPHNFFDYTPSDHFDLIWDYTFLCAIEPHQRQAWAARMHQLLAPAGELWTLIFPVHPEPMNPGGPPHPLTPELVRELLAPYFEARQLEPVKESHDGRAGKEWIGRWTRR
ncbi:MAG TPA: methyltransferase domain-containing protein [Sorangium sp.]|nr:methyltransferase domain-containing protein [Sorangium sp.]